MGAVPSRRRALSLWLLVLLVVFGPATVRCDSPPVAVQLRITVAFAPADITAVIRIPRHPDNREACVALYVDGEAAQSCWPLFGDREPPQFIRTFKRLGPGAYVLVAALRRSDRTVSSMPMKLLVLSGA